VNPKAVLYTFDFVQWDYSPVSLLLFKRAYSGR
jgi:hypothetical protein